MNENAIAPDDETLSLSQLPGSIGNVPCGIAEVTCHDVMEFKERHLAALLECENKFIAGKCKMTKEELVYQRNVILERGT